jgi:hypothetical protein
VRRFFTWFIIMSQLVPISLNVSSEIVKTLQALRRAALRESPR